MTKSNSENNESNQSFLRAARAGNLQKVIEFLETGTDINTCNDIGLTALHLASKDAFIDVVKELIHRGAKVDPVTKKGNTPLHIASLSGKLEVIKILIDSGANINQKSTSGFTPLYMAAQEGHLDIVSFMLNHGADQSITTDDGFTPLAVALQQGHDRVVTLLLESDNRSKLRLPAMHVAAKKDDVNSLSLLISNCDDINQQSSSGFTPLHLAAHYGSERSVLLLLEHKADVNFQAKNNITPLHVAAKWGRLKIVQILLESGALVNCRTRDGLTPLHCAARSGHAQVCEKLVENGADVQLKSKNGLTPLHMTAQGDCDDAARVLLLRKANINEMTQEFLTALHVATHYGNEKVARVLLDRRCDPNSRAMNGFTPLHIACKKHRVKIVELLLKYGALLEATTESGLTPLHVAAFIGSKESVNMLIQKGANVEQGTMRAETPLHLATRNNQTEVVKILLRAGATADARAKENTTALHIATRNGNLDLVSLFLQGGSDPNAQTKDNYTPLHVAAKEGQAEAAVLLIENGANIEAKTKRGFTPLHISGKYNKFNVTRVLLQKKADTNKTASNGLTPLHVATHYQHPKIVQLLLENKADPKLQAFNGYTPLHISAKMNNQDIANMLLISDADPNAESRNGFTPLQLASQEGHTDMVSLLLEHKADVNHRAKNGLTSMHLAAQEDKVAVAKILIQQNAEISPKTNAGYTPLHTAAHFGQINMARYLIGLMSKEDINEKTELGFTPLHLAAQQGHLQLIYLLLDSSVDPNIRNNQGWTAAHIARRQHYLNIFEVLRKVTTEVISWEVEEEETEEIVVLEKPEHMGEHVVSDSEDEGDGPKRLTVQETIDYDTESLDRKKLHPHYPSSDFARTSVSNDDIWKELEYMATTGVKKDEGTVSTNSIDSRGDESLHETGPFRDLNEYQITEIQHEKVEAVHLLSAEASYKPSEWDFEPDNIQIIRKPVSSGFLVSFMVDARGGCMQAQRFPNLRFFVPPSAALGPTRLVCRLIRPTRMSFSPALNDGDGFACRIMEMGPSNAQFNSFILIEVPHYASLRGREREIIILRSDNGETWKEHPIEATDQAIQNSIGLSFDDLMTNEEARINRVQRILTNDLPQYFALITRIRQEVALIGPDGVVMSSSVVPQVQAVFPEGALLKKTRVGIQAHEIPSEVVQRLLGSRVSCSPIISIEPRRRKFHKPITLTVPLPKSLQKGIQNDPSNPSGPPNLRLLCSITGGSAPAVWEDITGSTPLSFQRDCVSFTTTVSARLWLIDCPNVQGVAEMATAVYRESIVVPYIGQFVVYGRRHDPEEAQFRILGLTDDSVDKTLECQEHFQLLASGPLVEVLHNRPHWIETAGNLVPVTKTGEQLSMQVEALNENRISFLVRTKDLQLDPKGKLAILLHQRNQGSGAGVGAAAAQKPITTLEICLPSEIVTPSDTLRRKKVKAGDFAKTGVGICRITRSDLDLKYIADQLNGDWQLLAKELGVDDEDALKTIRNNSSDRDSAYALLILWKSRQGSSATGNRLETVLNSIGRDDIIKNGILNSSFVNSDDEKIAALRELDASDNYNQGLLKVNKAASVDESMVVEVGDETASQRANDIQNSEFAEEDESIIVAVNDPRSKRLQPSEISSAEKADAFMLLIDKLNELIPEPEVPDDSVVDEDSICEDCIVETIKKPKIMTIEESAIPAGMDKTPEEEDVEEDSIKQKTLRDAYAEYKPPVDSQSPPISPRGQDVKCEFERKSGSDKHLPDGRSDVGLRTYHVGDVTTTVSPGLKVRPLPSDSDDVLSVHSSTSSPPTSPLSFKIPIHQKGKSLEILCNKISSRNILSKTRSTTIDIEGNTNYFKQPASNIADHTQHFAHLSVEETVDEIFNKTSHSEDMCRFELQSRVDNTVVAPTVIEQHVSLQNSAMEVIHKEELITNDYVVEGEFSCFYQGFSGRFNPAVSSESSSECDFNYTEDDLTDL